MRVIQARHLPPYRQTNQLTACPSFLTTFALLPHLAVDVMLPHFEDAGNDTYGTTMSLAAIRSYLDSKGVDSQQWWLNVQTTIVQVRAADALPSGLGLAP